MALGQTLSRICPDQTKYEKARKASVDAALSSYVPTYAEKVSDGTTQASNRRSSGNVVGRTEFKSGRD